MVLIIAVLLTELAKMNRILLQKAKLNEKDGTL